MVEYVCAIVRVVWNMDTNRYDTLYFSGPVDFNSIYSKVPSSKLWVSDYSKAMSFDDFDYCHDLCRQVAMYFPGACCETLKLR